MLFDNSRYTLSRVITSDTGYIFTSQRIRLEFEDLPENRYHVVMDGDTLHTLAAKYLPANDGIETGFWWAIADFQPEAINDPTLKLKAGTVLVIPAKEYIETQLSVNIEEEAI